MGLILDTDYCVAVLRDKLTLGTSIPKQRPLHIPVTVLVELLYGALRSEKAVANLTRLDTFMKQVSVLPFDTSAARQMASLKLKLELAGAPLATPDLEIASVALVKNMPLVTHNIRHFQRVPGLQLIDWLP